MLHKRIQQTIQRIHATDGSNPRYFILYIFPVSQPCIAVWSVCIFVLVMPTLADRSHVFCKNNSTAYSVLTCFRPVTHRCGPLANICTPLIWTPRIVRILIRPTCGKFNALLFLQFLQVSNLALFISESRTAATLPELWYFVVWKKI